MCCLGKKLGDSQEKWPSLLPAIIVMDEEDGKGRCIHTYTCTPRETHTQNLGQKENGLLCWQQIFPNPRPWAILCSQAGYYMATIRGAGAQHLVVSYSGPSVAADCTVSQPGGPPSMTLASHSRVNQESAIIQWARIEPHSDWKLYRGKGMMETTLL